MISKDKDSQNELLEVLESYAVATPDGNDKKLLDRWIEEHPAFALDLIQFAANRELLKYPSTDDFKTEDDKLEYLRRSRETYNKFIQSRSGLLKSIIKRAEEMNLKKKELSQTLGISISILSSLENRALQFSTIPKTFIDKIASVLEIQTASVSAYLQQPALGAQFHKNHTRPDEARTVSFSDAVKSDLSLTQDQKEQLLSMQ